MAAIAAQITFGELQKSDQICSFVDVYKEEGTRESVLGVYFYRVAKRYLKKGEYGRAYGGFLSLASLPKNVRALVCRVVHSMRWILKQFLLHSIRGSTFYLGA